MAEIVFGDVVMPNERFEALNSRVNTVAEDVATTKANVAILLERTRPYNVTAMVSTVVGVLTAAALAVNFAISPIRASASDALDIGIALERRTMYLETKHDVQPRAGGDEL